MPATYTIDRKNRVVLSAAFGTFTMEDAMNQINQLLADPAFDSTFGQLLDFSAVAFVNLTPAQIKRLADYSLFSASSRRALFRPRRCSMASPGCTPRNARFRETPASLFSTR